MAFMSIFIILVALAVAAQGSLVPVKVPKVDQAQFETKSYTLTGSSGNFSYPVFGKKYGNHEKVYIQLQVDALSVFTVERYDIEYPFDNIYFFNSENSALSKSVQLSGTSSTPIYYKVSSDVFGHFESDALVRKSGFTITWGPLNTVKAEGIIA